MAPRRVEVVYFPKRPRSVRRASLEAPADPSYTRTVEFRPQFDAADPDDGHEHPTESLVVLPEAFREELARASREVGLPERRGALGPPEMARPASSAKKGTAPAAARDAAPAAAPAATPAAAKKPRSRSKEVPAVSARGAKKDRKQRTITLEIDTDPALRYHVRKLDELLGAPSPTEPLRSMTRHELAEMSLFGHQLFESGRLEEARVVFEGLVGLDLADAFPHTMLGTVYLAMGRPDRAAALFDAALALDPDDLAARVYRAELRLSGGESRAALQVLNAVVKAGPEGDPFVERARRLIEMASSGPRQR